MTNSEEIILASDMWIINNEKSIVEKLFGTQHVYCQIMHDQLWKNYFGIQRVDNQ
jgi:hypothetical protein